MTDNACTAKNQRQRLKRMIDAVRRPITPAEASELDAILMRVNPSRVEYGARFVGMNALTLSHETLGLLKKSGLVFPKVNGIGALGAMFVPSTRGKVASVVNTNTMIFVRRDGVFAIDNVLVPLRRGRVLIDGELCARRRKLSLDEKARISAPIKCVVGFNYLDPEDDLPENDSLYDLCFAAHDLLVDDEPATASSRGRAGDALCMLEPLVRLEHLRALLQCAPAGDSRADNVFTAATELTTAKKTPAVTVFFKQCFLASQVRCALTTIPHALRGVSLDGVIFSPGTGAYKPGETHPELLKYKAWRDNTTDLAIIKRATGYKLFVRDHAKQARALSGTLWLGDTPDEIRVTRETLALEEARLAAGGNPDSPLILECEPSVADMDEFLALRTQFTNSADLVAAAGAKLRWRPTGVVRDDKVFPNSELNVTTIIAALANYVTPDDIARQIGVT